MTYWTTFELSPNIYVVPIETSHVKFSFCIFFFYILILPPSLIFVCLCSDFSRASWFPISFLFLVPVLFFLWVFWLGMRLELDPWRPLHKTLICTILRIRQLQKGSCLNYPRNRQCSRIHVEMWLNLLRIWHNSKWPAQSLSPILHHGLKWK